MKDSVDKITDTVTNQAECAVKLLKDDTEDYTNMALYHISVLVKIALRILCGKHKIGYTDDDSIVFLYDKVYRLLPVEMLDLAEEACYWHNDLQYESKNIKTNDEVRTIGRRFQNYYNDTIVPYLNELLEAEEATAGTNAIIKF